MSIRPSQHPVGHAAVVLLIAIVASLASPGLAAADTEVTGVVGAFIGDDLRDVLGVRPGNIDEDFDNAPLFGGRLGYSVFPFLAELSVVVSPSAVNREGVEAFAVRAVYAEAGVFLLLFPGPLSPFVGGGIGLHRFTLDAGGNPTETLTGYHFGGGVRLKLGTLGVRVDARDHITPLDGEDLGEEFKALLGLAEDGTLHNIEVSVGVTLTF